MDYEKLLEASKDFCDLRSAIKENNLRRYDIFKRMDKSFEEFDSIAKTIGLQDCTFQKNGIQPGGEYIAYRLGQFAIREATKVKPGDGQFMCIVAGSKGRFDDSKGVALIQLNQDDISTNLDVLKKGFKFKGGAFQVAFKEVFGQ